MSVSRNRSTARQRLEQQVETEALSYVNGFEPLSPRPCEAAVARPEAVQRGLGHWWSLIVRWWKGLKGRFVTA